MDVQFLRIILLFIVTWMFFSIFAQQGDTLNIFGEQKMEKLPLQGLP